VWGTIQNNTVTIDNINARIVIATNALGMGIDIINCYSIVLYGAPHNVLDLVQEIGRAGRDGKDSVAMVLYNSFNLRTVEPDHLEHQSTMA
jgi:ATP-dependent DNA helicase RecQ